MKPNKITKPKPKTRPTGFLKEIKEVIDSGHNKQEGNLSITNIHSIYIVKNGTEVIHEGKDFRTAYDLFLKSVIGKIYR